MTKTGPTPRQLSEFPSTPVALSSTTKWSESRPDRGPGGPNKARLIRDVLRIGQLDPEFCRRELLASNPMSWMISVGGIIVDVRTMPPEVQAEAWRRGLIPDHPARPGDE